MHPPRYPQMLAHEAHHHHQAIYDIDLDMGDPILPAPLPASPRTAGPGPAAR